ncbi:MAG TPA: restriction endonuclease subunit S [Actinomycetota bacterium]|nr:restriction endonuclease subunit S [Actinomycetota bacterium]
MTWAEVPLRRLFKVVNGGTPTSDPGNWDGGIPWATPVDLGRQNGRVIETTDRTLSRRGLETGSATVPGGSLVLSTRAPIGYVAQTVGVVAFNQGCRGLVPVTPCDIRYYRYVLGNIVDRLQARGVGSTFLELTTDALASTRLSVPPPGAQRAIADFLDVETAQIDALVAKKGQLLSLLEQRRIAVIDRELWNPRYDLRRLKHVAGRPTSGNRDHSFTESEEGVPCLRGLNVRDWGIDRRALLRVSQEDATRHRATNLQAGDVVVVRSGNAGTAAVVPPDLDGANCVDLIIIRRSVRLLPELLCHGINSARSRSFVAAGSDNAALGHFNAQDAGELPVPVPPAEEQVGVKERLEATVARIRQASERIHRQLALLQEHRQALITAAVTGELEVA